MSIINIPLRWILSAVVGLLALLFVAVLEINRFGGAGFYPVDSLEVQKSYVIPTPPGYY